MNENPATMERAELVADLAAREAWVTPGAPRLMPSLARALSTETLRLMVRDLASLATHLSVEHGTQSWWAAQQSEATLARYHAEFHPDCEMAEAS